MTKQEDLFDKVFENKKLGRYEYPEIIKTNNWHDCIIENAIKYYNGRRIVIWGAFATGNALKKRLEREYIFKDIIFVDSDKQKQNWNNVYDSKILKGRSNDYYVIVPLNYKKSIVEKLVELGYQKNKDYYYFCDCIKEFREDYYEDFHGNKILGYHSNFSIMFYGFGSIVKIGDNPRILNGKLNVGTNASIEIGEDFQLTNTPLRVKDGARLRIGKRVWLDNMYGIAIEKEGEAIFEDDIVIRLKGRIRVMQNAFFYMGEKTSSEEHLWINVNQYSEMKIGKQCMLSSYVTIMNNARHSIFDIETGDNISSSFEICKNSDLTIGDHVWIGHRSMVYYGSDIGNGSIIGAQSFIKNKVPNNCIAIGQPFRITRENIAWSKKATTENIEDCGSDYINFTKRD